MIELLHETIPELQQLWRRTCEFKQGEWKAASDLAKKALENAGLKTKLPSHLEANSSEAAPSEELFEAAYRSVLVGEKPQEILRFGREAIHKELEKSASRLKQTRGKIGSLDSWKEQATSDQRADVRRAEEHMRQEMAKYDRMADESEKGFYATAGIGCGFGIVAFLAHIVLTVVGSGGFLHGPVLYGVMALTALPIMIGMFTQLAKSAQRASVEGQLYTAVREARKAYQNACEAADRQAKEQHKKLLADIQEIEQKHQKLVDAYRMLGTDPPGALRLSEEAEEAAA